MCPPALSPLLHRAKRAAWLGGLAGLSMAVTFSVAGCSSGPQRPERLSAPPAEVCRDGSPSPVRLDATAVALPSPSQDSRDTAYALGTLARRVILSVDPENLAAGVQMTWSKLSVRSFGGTLETATRLVTDLSSMVIDPSSRSLEANKGRRRQEIVNVEFSPGEIVVTRTAQGRASLFGTVMLDLTVTPGGVPVDETVVHVSKLWTDARKPVTPRDVDIQLAPVRHPPGIGEVDASFTLEYSLQRGRAPAGWRCATEATATLASKEEARPPLWDLGVSELNETRTAWLALYDDRLGPIRAIFDTPEAATAFANWGRATRATHAGQFSIGLFTATPDVPLRPTAPVDSTIARTLRLITPEDWDTMRVGRLGEP